MPNTNTLNICDTFWMVWCEQASPPRRKHATSELAWAEAERLTIGNPSKQFYVLKCVGRCRATQPPVIRETAV